MHHCSTALVADTSNLQSGDVQGNSKGVTSQRLLVVKRESYCFFFRLMCFRALRYILIRFSGVYNQPALASSHRTPRSLLFLSDPLSAENHFTNRMSKACPIPWKCLSPTILSHPRRIPRRQVSLGISSAQCSMVR